MDRLSNVLGRRARLLPALLLVAAGVTQVTSASELPPAVDRALDQAVVRIGVCEPVPNFLVLTAEQRMMFAVSVAQRELEQTGQALEPAAIAARIEANVAELPDQVALCGALNPADWRSIPEVFVVTSAGTGFIVEAGGHVVTNEHVVANAAHEPHPHVVVFDGSAAAPVVRAAEVRWRSVPYDLAVLRVPGLDPARAALPVSNPEIIGLHRADRVWKAGYPVGSDFGIAANYRPTEGKGFNLRVIVDPGTVRAPPGTSMFLGGQSTTPARVIEHNAPINPGDSGGPLIDACGRVVAINEHKITGEAVDSTYRSVDATHLIDGLRELAIPFQLDSRTCDPNGPDGPRPVDPVPAAVPPLQAVSADASSSVQATPATTADSYNPFVLAAAAVVILALVALRLRRNARLRSVAPASDVQSAHAPVARGTCGVLVGTGRLAGREWRLDGAGELLVGRRDAQLEINDDVISTRHARIGWDSASQRVWVEDLQSLNGTYRGNGERVPAGGRIELSPGQRCHFAEREFGLLLENR